MIEGCIILSPQDAEKYIHHNYQCNLPANIIEDCAFVRVYSTKELYDKCKPCLDYVRRYYNADRRAYMVKAIGMRCDGLSLVPYSEYHWLRKCDKYNDVLGYINGDTE